MRNLSICMIGALLLLAASSTQAGGSCVVVIKLGDTIAIDWEVSPQESALSATEKAEARLKAKGFHKKYQDPHPLATSDLEHAFLVVIKTQYTTLVGRQRTSYGCGFSAVSVEQAGQAAVRNLDARDWGWKPEFGYELVETIQF